MAARETEAKSAKMAWLKGEINKRRNEETRRIERG